MEIQAGDRAAAVTLNWHLIDFGEGYQSDTDTPLTMNGAFDSGSVSAYSTSGNIELAAFYHSGDKQYGIGTMELPSGETVYIGLVRP